MKSKQESSQPRKKVSRWMNPFWPSLNNSVRHREALP
jgi:hypothetical protein